MERDNRENMLVYENRLHLEHREKSDRAHAKSFDTFVAMSLYDVLFCIFWIYF